MQFSLNVQKVVLKYPNNHSTINKATNNGNVCDIIGCMHDTGMRAIIVACSVNDAFLFRMSMRGETMCSTECRSSLPPPPKMKKVMFSPLSVCLFVCLFVCLPVCRISQKVVDGFA